MGLMTLVQKMVISLPIIVPEKVSAVSREAVAGAKHGARSGPGSLTLLGLSRKSGPRLDLGSPSPSPWSRVLTPRSCLNQEHVPPLLIHITSTSSGQQGHP